MNANASLSQVAGMAALVASLLYFPVGAVLALLCFAARDVSIHSFITFGDTFNPLPGLLMWWVFAFVPAFAYAAHVSRDA